MKKEAKQVIVVRKDLNMRKGKIAAQVAHASMGALLKDSFEYYTESKLKYIALPMDQHSAKFAWLDGPFTKICVYVDSEEELLGIRDKAEAAGILNCLITDAGKTEFNGVPTKTCLAIGPAWVEEVDKLTGHLKLL